MLAGCARSWPPCASQPHPPRPPTAIRPMRAAETTDSRPKPSRCAVKARAIALLCGHLLQFRDSPPRWVCSGRSPASGNAAQARQKNRPKQCSRDRRPESGTHAVPAGPASCCKGCLEHKPACLAHCGKGDGRQRAAAQSAQGTASSKPRQRLIDGGRSEISGHEHARHSGRRDTPSATQWMPATDGPGSSTLRSNMLCNFSDHARRRIVCALSPQVRPRCACHSAPMPRPETSRAWHPAASQPRPSAPNAMRMPIEPSGK